MNIDRIKLSEEINVFGRHFWAGFEAALNENDNPVECMRKLQDRIDEFCNPVINESQRGTSIRTIDDLKTGTLSQEELIVFEINSCKDIRVLECYRLIAKTKPEYQEAYDKKYSELIS